MSIDLSEAFEAGCEQAYEAAYGEMVELWGEKTAGARFNKLKDAVRSKWHNLQDAVSSKSAQSRKSLARSIAPKEPAYHRPTIDRTPPPPTSIGRRIKQEVARTGHQIREGATGRRSVSDEHGNLQRPGARNMTGKEQAISGAKGAGKALGAAGVAGGVGYGGYRGYQAATGDKKR